MYLYHYFDKRTGPFKSLTEVSREEAQAIIDKVKAERPNSQCASRHDKYVEYRHNCEAILRREFDLRTLSFTYGDSMPTFSDSVNDGKEYRKKLYTYEEILKVVEKYGLPQDWNDDGAHGPERYIEVHVWSDKTIKRYL